MDAENAAPRRVRISRWTFSERSPEVTTVCLWRDVRHIQRETFYDGYLTGPRDSSRVDSLVPSVVEPRFPIVCVYVCVCACVCVFAPVCVCLCLCVFVF